MIVAKTHAQAPERPSSPGLAPIIEDDSQTRLRIIQFAYTTDILTCPLTARQLNIIRAALKDSLVDIRENDCWQGVLFIVAQDLRARSYNPEETSPGAKF